MPPAAGTGPAPRRAGRMIESAAAEGGAPAVADQLRHAANALTLDLDAAPAGRMDVLSDALAATLRSVDDAARAACETISASVASLGDEDPTRLAAARIALSSLDDLRKTASRILDSFPEESGRRPEVVWLDRPFTGDGPRPAPPPGGALGG